MAAPTRILVSRPVGWISEGMLCIVSPDSALHGGYVDAQSYDDAVRALADLVSLPPAPRRMSFPCPPRRTLSELLPIRLSLPLLPVTS